MDIHTLILSRGGEYCLDPVRYPDNSTGYTAHVTLPIPGLNGVTLKVVFAGGIADCPENILIGALDRAQNLVDLLITDL